MTYGRISNETSRHPRESNHRHGSETTGRLSEFPAYVSVMPEIHLEEETIERLDRLRVDDESYDELITELLNIYEAEELTMHRSGDG